MSGAIPPLPNQPTWRGAQFKKKHRDKFTSYVLSDKSKMNIKYCHDGLIFLDV
jgi:hypothetical protein